MNAWLDRFVAALPGSPHLELSRDEAALVLDLAGAASRSAGARQFAPLATYLAGLATAAAGSDRLALLRAAVEAAASAGPATEPLGID